MTLANRLDDVGVARGQSYARARLHEIDHSQPDDQRCGRDNFKIDQRFDAHATDLAQCTGAGDTDNDRGEDEGRDDRLDQVDKDVAQKINRVPPIGPHPANHDAHC